MRQLSPYPVDGKFGRYGGRFVPQTWCMHEKVRLFTKACKGY